MPKLNVGFVRDLLSFRCPSPRCDDLIIIAVNKSVLAQFGFHFRQFKLAMDEVSHCSALTGLLQSDLQIVFRKVFGGKLGEVAGNRDSAFDVITLDSLGSGVNRQQINFVLPLAFDVWDREPLLDVAAVRFDYFFSCFHGVIDESIFN